LTDRAELRKTVLKFIAHNADKFNRVYNTMTLNNKILFACALTGQDMSATALFEFFNGAYPMISIALAMTENENNGLLELSTHTVASLSAEAAENFMNLLKSDSAGPPKC
jgi:hypothetical protein